MVVDSLFSVLQMYVRVYVCGGGSVGVVFGPCFVMLFLVSFLVLQSAC